MGEGQLIPKKTRPNFEKFCAERGLAFRGDNEIIGSPHNGNFLGILELISEYDPFLREHIQSKGSRGKGNVSYLSSTIVEELIEIMGQEVRKEIVKRLKKSKYYSISMDSTPDFSHVNQLCLVFRYVEYNRPVERFVIFMANRGHKATDMYNALIEFLNINNIDLSDCRGQRYDNASAMSGKYNGLQTKIRDQNPLQLKYHVLRIH